jgi:hypothetical protein
MRLRDPLFNDFQMRLPGRSRTLQTILEHPAQQPLPDLCLFKRHGIKLVFLLHISGFLLQ